MIVIWIDENVKDQEKKAKDQEERTSFFQKICPCVGRKEEPEILEYQSESRESF